MGLFNRLFKDFRFSLDELFFGLNLWRSDFLNNLRRDKRSQRNISLFKYSWTRALLLILNLICDRLDVNHRDFKVSHVFERS